MKLLGSASRPHGPHSRAGVTPPNPSANGPIPEAASHGQPTMFRDERPAPSRWRCTTLHLHKRNFHTPPLTECLKISASWPSGAAKPHFGCEGGHLGALEWGSAATYRDALEPHVPVAQRSSSRATPTHNHGWLSFRGVSLSPGDPEPRFERAEGVSRSLGEPKPNSPVRNPFRSDYFKSGCEQQPSPKARETRPPRGRVFRFVRRDFEGWVRAGGHRVSRSLNRRVARTPPLADRMGRKSLRVSPREGAGLRLGRSRWSVHYPRGRGRRFATSGCVRGGL